MALDVPIPPWLHGPQTDPANAYLQAFHIGSQLSMEQARLQEAQVASQRDAQIRERALEANLERAKQEIANRAAYQAASLGIRQQAVDSALQRTSQVAAREAARFAANERLTQGLQNGTYKTLEQAVYDNPAVLTGGTITSLINQQRASTHFGTHGLVQRLNPKTGQVETLSPEVIRPSAQVAAQRVKLTQQMPGMYKALQTMDSQSPEFRMQKAAIEEAQKYLENTKGGMMPSATAAPAVGAAAVAAPGVPGAAEASQPNANKYPNLSILTHKDGSKWEVRGDRIFRLPKPGTEAAAAAPVSTMLPQGGVDESAALLPSEQEEIDTAPPTDEEPTD